MNVEAELLAILRIRKLANKISAVSTPRSSVSKKLQVGAYLLPPELCADTRGYIERVCQQINACYECSSYDAVAVLMRRLLETLVIEVLAKQNLLGYIQDEQGKVAKQFGEIIGYIRQQNKNIGLSRVTIDTLENISKLGGNSAHLRTFNAKKEDIKREVYSFRAAVEDLLYHSGLRG